MLVLIAYDVNTESLQGKRRLRRVARLCMSKGRRVQYSLFECLLDNAEYAQLKHELIDIIDTDRDSLRFYNLGKSYKAKIEIVGYDKGYDPEGSLII